MNAHQTLEKVKEGGNICPSEVTKALYLTGDLSSKNDKYALGRAYHSYLLDNPQGLTVGEVAKAFGKDVNAVRIAFKRLKNVYIHSWKIMQRNQRATAIWKAVKAGDKVPENAPNPSEMVTLEQRIIGYKPQGKTIWQPVAPWPKDTH